MRVEASLVRGAQREAQLHGEAYVLDAHFLLALLRSAPEELADTLSEVGLNYQIARSAYDRLPRSYRAPQGESVPQAEVAPVAYMMLGRAEGIAIGLGATSVGLGHVLLALTWDAVSPAAALLVEIGISGSQITAALTKAGLAVPVAAPPELRKRRWGTTVRLANARGVGDVVQRIRSDLPADAVLFFERGDGEIRLQSEEHVDLEGAVRRATGPR